MQTVLIGTEIIATKQERALMEPNALKHNTHFKFVCGCSVSDLPVVSAALELSVYFKVVFMINLSAFCRRLRNAKNRL